RIHRGSNGDLSSITDDEDRRQVSRAVTGLSTVNGSQYVQQPRVPHPLMNNHRTLAGWLVAAWLLAPTASWAYRPFISTDPAVADPSEVEIELGYFTARARTRRERLHHSPCRPELWTCRAPGGGCGIRGPARPGRRPEPHRPCALHQTGP